MRVLYISNANAMAGASLALLHIVREMRKRGHETLVVTPADKGPLPAKLNEVGCPCIQINMRGNFYPTNPNPIFYLPRGQVITESDDMLHACSFQFHHILFGHSNLSLTV